MSQNKKAWFYTEGFSEELFVKWLFRNHFQQNISISKTDLEFLNENNKPVIYIHNCRSVDRIPIDINDKDHWVKRSGAAMAVVVCDIEGQACPIKMKDLMLERVDLDAKNKQDLDKIDKSKHHFVFSIPTLEQIYCHERNITENVLKKTYKKIYSKDSPAKGFNLDILDSGDSPIEKIKKLFKHNEMTYKKREFAENFFSQLDYEKSSNKTVSRLYLKIKHMFMFP